MKFDLPSFLLGYGAGATTVFLGKRLRPLLLELATLLYRFSDTVMAKAAMKQEDLEDLLAEARARARRHTEPATAREQAQA
uniref:Uncharacterized protein n=1 Tax=Vitiosangium cumulatum TaxID=1867796 RepID=A0A7D5BG68_9BACT|nr:hypothetical protein [Vitiosangium cumulatum]